MKFLLGVQNPAERQLQKVWMYKEYGPKEVLKLEDFPIPCPQHDQLLVQVKAAALNPIDFKFRQRPIVPLDFPVSSLEEKLDSAELMERILCSTLLTTYHNEYQDVCAGCDMAGVVVGKGDSVSRFEIGDEVYGNIQNFTKDKIKQPGTLTEFIVVEEELVARKPKKVSFEEAASLPVALQTAIEGFKTAGFKKGQSVFIVGGAGGVGSLVIQLAKQLYGASFVTATTSTTKVEFVKSLGADKVVDYTQTRYEDIKEKYDLVYDTIGDSKNSYVVAKEEAPIIDITWPPSNPNAMHSSLTISGEVLEKIEPYLENGKLKATIDPASPFHFYEVIEAFSYLETGRARGKVVISPFPSIHEDEFL